MTPFPDIGMTDNPLAAIGPPIRRMPIRQIQKEVCHKYDISLAEMLSRRQFPTLVAARHEAIRRAYDETNRNYSAIAREFNMSRYGVKDAVVGDTRGEHA